MKKVCLLYETQGVITTPCEPLKNILYDETLVHNKDSEKNGHLSAAV